MIRRRKVFALTAQERSTLRRARLVGYALSAAFFLLNVSAAKRAAPCQHATARS